MRHLFKLFLATIIFFNILKCFANQPYVINKKIKIGNYNSIVNAIFFDENYQAQITYGKNEISNLQNVKHFVKKENALAGINASYFKPDTGTPLGLSIIDNKLITGPLLKRSCFGIKESKYYFDIVEFKGNIKIGKENLKLTNINQPITSINDIIIYDKNWGKETPKSTRHNTIGIKNDKISLISSQEIDLNQFDYAIKIPKKIKVYLKKGQKVSRDYELYPKIWNKMEFAIAAGPCLVKNGDINISKEHFSKSFCNQKAPRSAIGVDKYGNLALITVDGRQKCSKGVSLYQFAKVLKNLGMENALNLDGGSSTQFVYQNKLQNIPSIKDGAIVTNAIIIKKKTG